MSYEVSELDGRKRAAAKQASRENDACRLAAGLVDKHQLKRENSFFGALLESKFRIVAIGGKPIAKPAEPSDRKIEREIPKLDGEGPRSRPTEADPDRESYGVPRRS